MKPSQALTIIDTIVEQTRMTPAEHRQVQTAMLTLRALVFPPKGLEPPETQNTAIANNENKE